MAKKIKCEKLIFPIEMYNNIYGSIVICGFIFSEQPVEIKDIIKKWNATVKNKGKNIKWGIEDPKIIDKTLQYFGIKRPDNFPIAFVQSNVNCLFAPFVDGNLLPLREDGYMGHTLSIGKVYPLSFIEGD